MHTHILTLLRNYAHTVQADRHTQYIGQRHAYLYYIHAGLCTLWVYRVEWERRGVTKLTEHIHYIAKTELGGKC